MIPLMSLTGRKRGGGRVVLSHKSTNSAGVAVLFAKSFTPVSFEVEEVVEGRMMVVKTIYEQLKLVFINVYAPTSGLDRVDFLSTVWRRMRGDGRQYTWAHSRGILISLTRLDQFYCFKHHLSIFKKCGITPVGLLILLLHFVMFLSLT